MGSRSMGTSPLLLVVGCTLVLPPTHASAQLSVSLRGAQLSWRLGEQALGAGDQWLQVRDLAQGEGFAPVPLSSTGDRFSGATAGLTFSGNWKRLPHAAELTCTVAAQPPADRALIVRVSLPLAAVGWDWWDDILQKRRIEAGRHYARLISWDGPRQGSTYPCCAVSGPKCGLSLAVPLTEPRVYRLAYDAGRRALEAEFDLGLSPDAARLPAHASFRLLVYPHDPAWGFRDALRVYYELFPGYAVRRAKEGGVWLLGFEPNAMACPWDFGFRFDEGAQYRAGYDCAHDILPFVYTEPWGKYEHFGDHPTPDRKPRYGPGAPLLTPEQLRQSVLKDVSASPDRKDPHFGGPRAEIARALVNSAVEQRDGSWIWHHWTDEWSPNDWLSNLLLDPDPNLPEPNRASIAWKYELDPAFEAAKRSGGELAGVYLDSIASFIGFYAEDFRRDHWRVAEVPLAASYREKAPAALHVFENYAFAAQVAERMRAQGKWVIGNTFQPYMQFFCPLLDMIGAGETGSCGLASDDYYAYLRAYGYRKPLSWMDYGFVNPKKTWEEKERGLQRCLFYAVHPGTGSFQTPADYEPSRPLFRHYEPLITWLDEGGWQPVTLARATTPGVLVERYGPAGGVTFLALRNPGRERVQAAIEIEPQARAPKGGRFIAWRLVADEPAPLTGTERLTARAELPPDGTEVLALGTREAVARLWLNQAERWLDRLAREARWLGTGKVDIPRDGDFEAGLQGWGAERPPTAHDVVFSVEEKQPLSGKRSFRAESRADKAFHALHQDVSLAGGRDYLLRFAYRWERPEGAAGTVTPRFGVKGPDGNWVAEKYLYFRDLQPTGPKAATCERPFAIPPGHSAGYFQFLFDGRFGAILIDDLAVTSPELEDARQRVAAIPSAASEGLASWRAAAAESHDSELLALAARQEATYRRLRGLTAGLPDEHSRRCLLLPVENFAEVLGRGIEVLTGVALHAGGSPPFFDLAVGDEATLPCVAVGAPADLKLAVEGGPEGVTVRTAPEVGWGWQDVTVHAHFTQGRQPVWLARRATIRLHPPLEVGAAGPVSAREASLRLRVRSWLAEAASVKLAGRAKVGETEADLPPVSAQVSPAPIDVALPLPADLAKSLDRALTSGGNLRLAWRAETPRGGTARGEVEVPVVRGAACPRLGAAPKADGPVDDAEWLGAARLEGFFGVQDGKPAARPTTVLIGHDGTTLYLAFVCSGQPKPQAQSRPHDGAVWEDDAVEVFLQPPGSEAYYHFAVNAVGSRYEARCQGGIDAGWNADWQAQTGAVADGWTVEIAIPLKPLAPAQGLWRANFGREEADTKLATCWCPTFSSFHAPARFGTVAF